MSADEISKRAQRRFRTDGRHFAVALAATGWLLCAPPLALAAPPELLIPLVTRTAMATLKAKQQRQVDTLRTQSTTKSLNLFRLNPAALDAPSLNLSIPGLRSFELTRTSVQKTGASAFIWFGSEGGTGGSATMVFKNGTVTGTFTSSKGLFRIVPIRDGTHALVQIETSKMPPEEPPSFRAKERRSRPSGSLLRQPGGPTHADEGPRQIEVLVAYTPSAKSAVTDIDSTIALAVAEANQAYANSGIKITLHLAQAALPVSYSEAGKDYDTILADLAGMSDVNKHRDQSQADLVAMLINQPDFCGLADAIEATPETAYAIVHYSCATGYYSFAHELGHLMGARHNDQIDSTATPFAYGHGFQHQPVSGANGWRTIMAYDCPDGCTRLQYFSSPLVKVGDDPMGTTAVNDNARVLNETAAAIAAFRPELLPGQRPGVLGQENR